MREMDARRMEVRRFGVEDLEARCMEASGLHLEVMEARSKEVRRWHLEDLEARSETTWRRAVWRYAVCPWALGCTRAV